MLTLSGSLRVFLALEPCDMRKSFDSLHALVVSQLGEDPRGGAVFAFTNRTRTLIKLLHWDGTGLWVHAKRLEKGTFCWPKPSDGSGGKLKLAPEALAMLTDGIDLKGARMRPWYERERSRLAPATASIVDGAIRMTPEREQQLVDRIALLERENELLRQKLDLVLRKLFGKSSETLDPAQLELLLGEPPGKAPASLPPDGAPEEANASSAARTERKPRRELIPDHLPVVEEVLLPEAVKACPDAWRRIGEECSDSLDYQPGKVFIRRLIRPVFVKIADRDAAPVTAKLPPRLQDGLTSAPGLIAHVLVSKYCDHLPFYRQEKILSSRHGVEIGRNTMCRWAELAAFWLKPLYQRIHDGLLQSGYLQADETPIRYLAPGTGKTGLGYLWALHRRGGDVLFQWHASRGSACLDGLLGGFRGILQCDGYSAYGTHAAKSPGITLAACWAHARRKFHEALQIGQKPAAGPLKAIATLYGIEKELRQSRAGPEERAAIRQRDSAPILQSLRGDLLQLRGHPSVTPKSPLGRAIKYTLGLWPRLEVFLRHGEVEADTNLTENAIRPTAVGKKNWLFVGGEDTGGRSAVICTIIESAKRHGHDPGAYLKDVLERLPGMKAGKLDALLPANWQPTGQAAAPAQMAG